MVAGESNVGGIVGFLRLENDQFVRAIDEAILKTEILDGKRVDVKLNAEEVRRLPQDAQRATSSIDGMAQGQRRLEDATRRVELAQLKVYEANDSGKASRIYAAQTELTKARRAESDAIYATYDANIKAASSADKVAESNDRAEKSIRKVGNSSRDSRSHVGALATAILTLGPALVPIAAGATALGAAFGGMGAAGVLAFVGVKREMEAGTAKGLTFKSAVDSVKSDVQDLAKVAAGNVLKPFQDVVRDLNSRMPALRGQISDLSAVTGRAAAALAGGLLSAFQSLEPLMRDAAAYVLDLSNRFRDAMSGHGIVAFGDYVRSVFPQVMQAIESIVGAVAHLVAALAPLGLGTLSTLRILSDVINAIPVDVLATLATTASSVFIGFKTWQGLSALIGGVSTVMENLGVKASAAAIAVRGLQAAAGVIGVAIAALTWLISANAEANRENQQAVNDYADALRRSNGVIDESIRLMTSKKLSDDGAQDAAKKLGISLADLTSAALGEHDAIDRVNAIIDSHGDKLKQVANSGRYAAVVNSDLGNSANKVRDAIGLTNGQLDAGTQKYKDIAAGAAASTGALSDQAIAVQTLANKYGISVPTYQQIITSQKDLADKAAATTAQMMYENNAAGLLKQSLDLLNGKAIDAASAQNNFESQLANMGDHVTKTGKKITFTTTSIKDMSAASVALRGQLLGQIQSAEQTAEAYGQMTGSSEEGRKKLVELKDQIIKNAIAHGVDKDAVTSYVNEFLKVPTSVPPTKLDVDKAVATQKVKEFVAVINGVPTYREVFISVGSNAGAAVAGIASAFNSIGGSLFPKSPKKRATGALTMPNGVRAMAAGDITGRPSMIMRSTKPILWNEAPGGEAYISLAPQQRKRSQAIWEETGKLLGAGGGGGGGMSHDDMRMLARLFGKEIQRLHVITDVDAVSARIAGGMS